MTDKLRLGSEVRELKIGQSFTHPKAGAFHTIRYDFKPASVDINKMATVDVSSNNEVTVAVPHLDGSGIPQTVFKGSQRPFQKECVLIIDRVTGEITLEKLSSNVSVKKTRAESVKLSLPQDRANNSVPDRTSGGGGSGVGGVSQRPATPPIGQRQSNKTRVSTGSRRADRQITQLPPKHSPLHASPNPTYPSPGHHRSPKRTERDHNIHANSNQSAHSQSPLASLPLIGVDDFPDPVPPPPQAAPPQQQQQQHDNYFGSGRGTAGHSDGEHNGGAIGEISDSSSSDSSSDSDSDHDSGPDRTPIKGAAAPAVVSRANGHHNGTAGAAPKMYMPTQLLNDDLRLSDSGSDSD